MMEKNWDLYDYCMEYVETNSVLFFDNEGEICDISGIIQTGERPDRIPGSNSEEKKKNAVIACINLMNFYETTLRLSNYPKKWFGYVSVSDRWLNGSEGNPPQFIFHSEYYETMKEELEENYPFSSIKDQEFPLRLNMREHTMFYRNGLYMFESASLSRLKTEELLFSSDPGPVKEFRIWRRDSEIRGFRNI